MLRTAQFFQISSEKRTKKGRETCLPPRRWVMVGVSKRRQG
jgi:hypothetical protein